MTGQAPLRGEVKAACRRPRRPGFTRERAPGQAPPPVADINVTPMVDVMLVLLIIFMVSAPLLTVGVPLDLPQTAAKSLDRLLDAVAKAVSSACPLFSCRLRPSFDEGPIGPSRDPFLSVWGYPRLDSRSMGHVPQQSEVCIRLAIEDGFEIELQVCLTDQRRVVAKQPCQRRLKVDPFSPVEN